MVIITNNPGILSRLEGLFEVFYHDATPPREREAVWSRVADKLLELHTTWGTAGILYKDAIMRVSQFIVAHACEFVRKDADVEVYFYFIRCLYRAMDMRVPAFPDLYCDTDYYYDDDYDPYQGHDYSERERDEWEEERREEEREEWEEWKRGGGQGCGECIDVCRCMSREDW